MLFFRSEERVREWCAAHGHPMRPLVTMNQLWTLATTWYSTRVEEDSRRPQLDDDPGLIGFFTYRGAISDFASVEIKSGIVSFLGASSYTGTTMISGGIFIAANSSGSATGSGAVQVTRGALGGPGSIGGSVTIGGGRGPAVLAPAALPGNQPTLTIQSTLTFQNGGNYFYTFAASRNNSRADEVIGNGVTIAGGATITVSGIILGRLPLGTTFTVISNTAATPIAGTFANLHDGSILTIFGNHLQASYEGGDGNDLTLTIVR